VELLAEIHALAAGRPELRPAALLERFRDRPELPHLEQLLAKNLLVDADGAARELQDCCERLRAAALQQKLSTLLHKAGHETLSAGERAELDALRSAVSGGR
jgi:DNA primase